MIYQKFIKEQAKKAEELNKEESAVFLILEYITKKDTSSLYMMMDEEVTEEVEKSFLALYNAYLYENKPVQYLTGKSCFYGYDFTVNEDVLIPRYETEELVENILYKYDEYFKNQRIDVCDLATGSGCIGISLNLEEPNMKVIATDISAKALAVAKENNDKLGASVEFVEGDMLEPLKGKKFDIFVSNPPYIPEHEDVDSLVKDNEPNLALFGGEDGLKFYRIILEGVKPLLKDKAIIAFEHGYNKKLEIEELIRKNLPNAKYETLKDLEGKDRMTFIYVGDFSE